MGVAFERTWESRRGRSAGDEARESYYGIAPIHKPHWRWLIVFYFFLGGIAGASYAIGAIAELLGGPGNRQIARTGRYVSFAALLPSPILLILDLGRPDRFHHMLRILKVRSPMSVGTWVLTIFGGFCTLSAVGQAARDGVFGRRSPVDGWGRRLPLRAIALLGLLPAFFLAGYTGVLLAATAVPLWTRRHLVMGPLFLASAMSSATAALSLVLALTRGTNRSVLDRLEVLERLVLAAELVLMLAHRVGVGSIVARPLVEGHLGRIHRFGVLGVGLLMPIGLQLKGIITGRRTSRTETLSSSLLVLAGGFMFRYVMVMAGRRSADDPAATFAMTRSAHRDGQSDRQP